MPKKGRDWSGKVGNDPTKTIIVKQDAEAEVATEQEDNIVFKWLFGRKPYCGGCLWLSCTWRGCRIKRRVSPC